MMPSQSTTGHQLRTSIRTDGLSAFERLRTAGPGGAFRSESLLGTVVGSFAGNHDIVYVALAQAISTDAHESLLLLQLRDAGAADITHSTLHAADQLVHDHGDGAAIGNPTFDAFRNQLAQPVALAALF